MAVNWVRGGVLSFVMFVAVLCVFVVVSCYCCCCCTESRSDFVGCHFFCVTMFRYVGVRVVSHVILTVAVVSRAG